MDRQMDGRTDRSGWPLNWKADEWIVGGGWMDVWIFFLHPGLLSEGPGRGWRSPLWSKGPEPFT